MISSGYSHATPDSLLEVIVPTRQGKIYNIESTPVLSAANWNPIARIRGHSYGVRQIIRETYVRNQNRFYRVRVLGVR
jgi:hypothetical protein